MSIPFIPKIKIIIILINKRLNKTNLSEKGKCFSDRIPVVFLQIVDSITYRSLSFNFSYHEDFKKLFISVKNAVFLHINKQPFYSVARRRLCAKAWPNTDAKSARSIYEPFIKVFILVASIGN